MGLPIDKMLRAEFEDLSNDKDDNEKVVNVYSHGVHVMTLRVFKNYVDVENELTRERYNMLEVSENGAIYNDKPLLE